MLLVVLFAAAGCAELTRWDPYPETPRRAGGPVPGIHVVQPGETLFQIAFRYRLDWREVAAWNRLGNADRIYPGQEIRLQPPPGSRAVRAGQPEATTTRQPAPAPARPTAAAPPWRWPVTGELVWQFGQSRRNPTGIGIGGTDALEIRAAADGDVVYSGSGLIGYGQLIILKHNDSYLSAYGYNQALRVAEGDQVKAGQVIALMGRGPGDRPLLHFEIRRDGTPVDPARYLPPRQGP
ncbi:peptidoglycan DD-metalloendopeptidase family protein [Thioalkalivibrio sp. XN8]|nr:peptidoglycan DD-metalloendopeptidase family protein [Thioalkalivibrio sp. XN8]